MISREILSLRDIWKEHVSHSVDYHRVKSEADYSKGALTSICLDLYVGGTIQHLSTDECVQCLGCPFAEQDAPSPHCDMHLGIVQGFVEGVLERPVVLRRDVAHGRCTIHVCEEL